MLNKIQKGKRALIAFGIVAIILGALSAVGAVFCTIYSNARWWMIAISAVLYLIAILGLIVGITFVWTASAMKATLGNLKELNIPLLNGTLNVTKCPNCGTEIDKNDKFCPKCGKNANGLKTCPNCNAENKQDAKICTQCGKEL